MLLVAVGEGISHSLIHFRIKMYKKLEQNEILHCNRDTNKPFFLEIMNVLYLSGNASESASVSSKCLSVQSS